MRQQEKNNNNNKKKPFSSMFGTSLLWCLNLTFEWNARFCLGARNPLRTLMRNALQIDFTQKKTKVFPNNDVLASPHKICPARKNENLKLNSFFV